MAYVEVDIDLSNFETNDLLDELKYRGKLKGEDTMRLSARKVIQRLNELDCPDPIIEQLEAWEREPIADAYKLKKWIEMCEPKKELEEAKVL